MASKGNKIESWEANPWTPAPNANVANEQTMTSPEAQAARAKSAEVMAALKKGDKGEADRLMGKSEQMNDSLIPGMGKLKAMFLGRKKDGEQK
ncbi:hypothetical protein Q7P37_005022 [Cladosporium fusiforme]